MTMRTTTFVGLLFPLFLASQACSQPSTPPAAESPPATPVASAPSPAEVAARLQNGIDVSVHSGTVDWSEIAAAGHSFAFVKATEGMDLKDGAFDDHWPRMKAAGLIRGAYHFYVTEDDPEAQASFFIQNVELAAGDLAPVVDIEVVGHGTQPGLSARLKTWLERVEAHYGIRPIIYTTAKFWDANLAGDFAGYPLWVAEYEVSEPNLPEGWPAWHLWQWKGDAAVAGVQTSADLSRVNRDHPDLDLGALIVPARSAGGS